MNENLSHAMAHMLRSEGGFVNHPDDPGGMTNLGVTQRVWEEWVGHQVNEREMRSLTPEKVTPMYKVKYWDKVSGDLLPPGVDFAVFDFAVNSGPGRAVKMLQRVLQVKEDGVIGPKTLTKVRSMDSGDIVVLYNEARLGFLKNLPTWGTFGKGWGRRVAEVTTEAANMTA